MRRLACLVCVIRAHQASVGSGLPVPDPQSQGAKRADQGDVSATGSGPASPLVKLVVAPAELSALLRAYVDGIPRSAVPGIGVRPELAGPSGAHEPVGVIAGMVFAIVTRASCSARLKWPQKLDCWRVSCLLRGMVPRDREDKSVQKSRPGFVEIANEDCFDEQYDHLPVRPDEKSRAWGVNSFAALPMSGG